MSNNGFFSNISAESKTYLIFAVIAVAALLVFMGMMFYLRMIEINHGVRIIVEPVLQQQLPTISLIK